MIALRIAAFTIVLVLSYLFTKRDYLVLFIVMLYAHYLLQLVYSPNITTALWSPGRTSGTSAMFVFRLTVLLLAFSAAQFTPYLPIALYFGVHYVLTEVYGRDFYRQNDWQRFFHILTSSSLYALFVHRLDPFAQISQTVYAAIFLAGILGLLFCHFRNPNRDSQNSREAPLMSLIAYETCAVIFLVFGPRHDHPLANIIFYHVVWWAIYPLRGSFVQLTKRRPNVSLKNLKTPEAIYVFTSIAVSAALYVLLVQHDRYLIGILTRDLALWGNVHITVSFALSSSHPDFINKLFGKPLRSMTLASKEV